MYSYFYGQSPYVASTIQITTNHISQTWPWYIVRGAGFVAAGLLILLMLSGIGQVTGITYRYIEPIRSWAIHRALAIALCISIVIHVGFLLIDHYIKFSLPQILVPFLDQYNNGTKVFGIPLGSLAVTMGILAAYGVVIIVASSLGWINTKKTMWRKLHYISYAVMLLVFLHALYIGSDLKYGIFRSTWVLAGLVLLLAIVMRLWRSRVVKKREDRS